MSEKPKLFVTRDDYPCTLYEMLKDRFDITTWKRSEILSKEDLVKNVRGVFGIICYPANQIDKDVIDAAGSALKVICTYSVGFDHLDVKELKSRGIKIGFTPDIVTEATAEFAVSLLLATSRRIVESHQIILKGGWTPTVWAPLWMCGYGLHESTVGIVGCGRIGVSVLTKVKAFNPGRILYFSRTEKPEAKKLGGELKSIEEVMKESDFIFITLSQTEDTKEIINEKMINLMKSNAIIVNVGRGGLIDEKALMHALRNKKIGGAGLDVFQTEPLPSNHPFFKMENVVLTPHIGSATIRCRTEMVKCVAENVLAVLNNERMPNEVF